MFGKDSERVEQALDAAMRQAQHGGFTNENSLEFCQQGVARGR
jgi:hypothetical protein